MGFEPRLPTWQGRFVDSRWYCIAAAQSARYRVPDERRLLTTLFRPNPQGPHLPIQVTALQAEQLGGAGDVPVGFLELLEDIFALHCFTYLLKTAEAVQTALATRDLDRNVPRVHAHLRIQNYNAFDHVAQLAHIAWP